MSAKCFVASNIWLYAFMDSNSDKRSHALQLIESPDILLSTQVINEVCCNLLRKANYSEAEIQQTIRNFQACYPILNVTADIIRHTSTLLMQGVSINIFVKLKNEATKNSYFRMRI